MALGPRLGTKKKELKFVQKCWDCCYAIIHPHDRIGDRQIGRGCRLPFPIQMLGASLWVHVRHFRIQQGQRVG